MRIKKNIELQDEENLLQFISAVINYWKKYPKTRDGFYKLLKKSANKVTNKKIKKSLILGLDEKYYSYDSLWRIFLNEFNEKDKIKRFAILIVQNINYGFNKEPSFDKFYDLFKELNDDVKRKERTKSALYPYDTLVKEDRKIEWTKLDEALKDPRITNIAVSGAYDTGKSSFLLSYFLQRQIRKRKFRLKNIFYNLLHKFLLQ